MKNILDDVGDTKIAGELWDMKPDTVKKLAQTGQINAKKLTIGWAIDLTQPNPKKYKTNSK